LNKTILLPIPTNLQEAVQVTYNTAELGAVGGELSDLIARGSANEISNKFDSFMSGGGSLLKNIMSESGRGTILKQVMNEGRGNDVIQAATLGLRSGSGFVAAGVNRYFGSSPNPHITAIFHGVGLRTHNLSWKLSPQSNAESATLANIMNHFKAAMLPVRQNGNLTLKFPDEVDIYIAGSTDGYFYHFKRAVIQNFSANYAPDGIPSFFADSGAPTSVTFSLDILETTIHTRADYEDSWVSAPSETTGTFSGRAPEDESPFVEKADVRGVAKMDQSAFRGGGQDASSPPHRQFRG
jgi:hypothetical protein